MKAFRMAAYWPLLRWNSARSVGASTETTWRSMKLMVVSHNSSAIRMKSALRVKTGSNFGAAEVPDMGSQYHRCAQECRIGGADPYTIESVFGMVKTETRP